MSSKLNATPLLEKVLSMGASDLLLSVGNSPIARTSGVLAPIQGQDTMTAEDIEFFLSDKKQQ